MLPALVAQPSHSAATTVQRQLQVHLSAVERRELIERYIAGSKAHELSAEFGLCRQAVAANLERAGVKRSWTMTSEEVEVAVARYRNGSSLIAIGDELGRAGGTVRRALIDQGIALRRPWAHRQGGD